MQRAYQLRMAALQTLAEPLRLHIEPTRFAREALEATVAYVGVPSAPRASTRTIPLPRGGVALTTRLRGQVTTVEPERLVVEHDGLPTEVRCLLPRSLDLRALLGAVVTIDAREELRDGTITVDARVRDREGRLLLWTRDGALPEADDPMGVRVLVDVKRSALTFALRDGDGIARIPVPGIARIQTAEGPLTAVGLRSADGVAYCAF